MAKYCLNMLAVALELAVNDITYEDVATKFFEHFIYIANALNNSGLWDEQVFIVFEIRLQRLFLIKLRTNRKDSISICFVEALAHSRSAYSVVSV